MASTVKPAEVRKVAAFVEKLAQLEQDFGISVDTGHAGLGLNVPGTPWGTYATARGSDGELGLVIGGTE